MTYAERIPAPVSPPRNVHNLSTLLQELVARTEGETVSLKEMLDAIGRRSYGPILLLLGFVALSPLTIIPGSTWLVALVTLIVAMQILVGQRRPWLPGKILNVEFPRSVLIRGVESATPFVELVDRFLKPRLTFLTESPFVQVVALVCIGAALITFPLGLIPLAPMLPGFTIFLFGLALTARDGFVLILSVLALAAGFWALTVLGGKIADPLRTLTDMIHTFIR